MFAGIIKLAVLSAGGISNAVIWGIEKVVSEEFFRAVLVKVVKHVGPRLVAKTSNKLDDDLIAEVVKRLEE